ncbi:hypothetical protein SCHPADRAFT_938573 [Schizopora paradoxa]|uniref:Uncharacterized protein n=1 Tax=Schizopora paradoxa TaxID=27342 RepID=A0A0H2SEV8_9AGAM|nr:hypothetical protein SCHPADRAFT_938573 [Schizopora paradoxa]
MREFVPCLEAFPSYMHERDCYPNSRFRGSHSIEFAFDTQAFVLGEHHVILTACSNTLHQSRGAYCAVDPLASSAIEDASERSTLVVKPPEPNSIVSNHTDLLEGRETHKKLGSADSTLLPHSYPIPIPLPSFSAAITRRREGASSLTAHTHAG